MSSPIPPPPLTAPAVDANGTMTTIWRDWFTQMFQRRIGGVLSSSITQLETLVNSFDARITTATTNASTALTTANTAQSQVTSLTGVVSLHTAAISTLQSNINDFGQGRAL